MCKPEKTIAVLTKNITAAINQKLDAAINIIKFKALVKPDYFTEIKKDNAIELDLKSKNTEEKITCN